MYLYLLNTQNADNWSNNLSTVGQFFQIVFSLCIVIFAVIVVIKFIAKSSYKRGRFSNIQVLEGVGVGYQTVVQLVKVGNKFFLIGVSRERITLLSEIDESVIDLSEPEQIQFDRYFQKFLKKDKQSGD